MSTNFNKSKEFHRIFKLYREIDAEVIELRKQLIIEESNEAVEAFDEWVKDRENQDKKAHLLKELVDVLYVTYGAIESFGWDADAAFAEVHQSNLSKLDDEGEPIYREDGKVLKGPNYRLADMLKHVK